MTRAFGILRGVAILACLVAGILWLRLAPSRSRLEAEPARTTSLREWQEVVEVLERRRSAAVEARAAFEDVLKLREESALRLEEALRLHQEPGKEAEAEKVAAEGRRLSDTANRIEEGARAKLAESQRAAEDYDRLRERRTQAPPTSPR